MTTFQPSAVHLDFEVVLYATPSPITPAPQSSYVLGVAYLKHEEMVERTRNTNQFEML